MENLFEVVESIIPVLKASIEHDEQSGRLSGSVIAPLQKAGFYRLFLPALLGGLEADPLTVAKLTEQVAGYNAAAAWSIMVTNTGNWFCKFLPEQGVEEIYDRVVHPFCAGSFALPMTATRVEGGYLVTGQVPLCSNVHQAQWVTVVAIVLQNGEPVIRNGVPEMRSVTMKAEECRIVDTWYSIGMKSTDSNDVSAETIFVPEHRSFILSPHSEINKYYKGPLYRFPVVGIISCCLIVPVALAIVTNAIEEIKLLTGKKPSGSALMLKEKASFQRKLAMAEGLVRSARSYLHQTLSDCWNKVKTGVSANAEDRAGLLLAAAQVNHSCTKAMDFVYSAAGTSAVYKRNNILRHFTDLQVVRQHGFVNENRFETAAQLLLGLQPDFFPALL